MARKTTATRTEMAKPRKRNGASESDRNYRDILRDLAANPAVRYVAAGLATAVVTRVADKMAERYPEISSFIKENMDTMGERIDEFKDSMRDADSAH